MSEKITIAEKARGAKRLNSGSKTQRLNSSQSSNSPAEHILFLQRTIGNQAVQRLFKSDVIQTKLKIGQPGDIYEQEADRIAELVMRMPEPHSSNGKGERANVKGEKVKSSCDQNQIMRVSESSCPECPERKEEEEMVRPKPIAEQITPLVQRQVEPEEEEEESLQAKEFGGNAPELTPDLESRIQSIRGGGQALPESVRSYFEPRLGYDFSQVRVHNDSYAAESAQWLNARAFTLGRDVVFRAGEYAPDTAAGRRLLAHELIHVVQQGGDISCMNIQLFPAVDRWTFRNRGPVSPNNRCSWCPSHTLGVIPNAMVNGMELRADIRDHESGYQYTMRQMILQHTGGVHDSSSRECIVEDQFSNRPDNPDPSSTYLDTRQSPALITLFTIDRPGWPDPTALSGFRPSVTDVILNTSFRNWVEIEDPSGNTTADSNSFDWHNILWLIRNSRSSVGFIKDMSRSEINEGLQ